MLLNSKILTSLGLLFIVLAAISNDSLSQTENPNDSLELESILDNAKIFSQSGNNDSALTYFNLAENFTKEHHLGQEYKAIILKSKADHFQRIGSYSEAISHLEEIIQIYLDINDPKKAAKTYSKLGSLYKKLSRFQEALIVFNKAASIYINSGDSLGMASIELNVGNVLKSIDQTEMAKAKYYNAIRIFEAKNNLDGIADGYNNLGNIYKNEKNYDSAYYFMHKTLQYRIELGDKEGLAYIYNNLANLHKGQDSFDSALYYMNKSIILKHEIGNQTDLCLGYRSLAELYYSQKNYKDALIAIEKAKSYLLDESPLDLQVDVYEYLGKIYHATGDFAQSSTYLLTYSHKSDSLASMNKTLELNYQLMRYELLSDSLEKEKLQLSMDMEDVMLENKKLQLDNEKRKFNYLIVVLGIILLMGVLLLISFRRRLKESSEHQLILSSQNEELKRTLISKDEKEVLLKEIHHRVKNNLQIINSLIRLQSNFITPVNYTEKLKDTENRIRSMALIHEKLYKSQNLARLDIRNYIEELCFTILETYENNVRIQFKFKIQEKEFGIDSLIPLGLIINEILSNSIKYAFEGKEEGEISINLHFDENSTFLQIKDNGMGADLSWEELKEDSLGLDLVESLTEQLDGTMLFDTNDGFDYNFTFPLLH